MNQVFGDYTIIIHKLFSESKSIQICLFSRNVFYIYYSYQHSTLNMLFSFDVEEKRSVNATPWQNWLEKTNGVVWCCYYTFLFVESNYYRNEYK